MSSQLLNSIIQYVNIVNLKQFYDIKCCSDNLTMVSGSKTKVNIVNIPSKKSYLGLGIASQ